MVQLALWDSVAVDFRREICIQKLEPITIMVTSINPKIYQGKKKQLYTII